MSAIMSALKCGRKRKRGFNNSSNVIEFDVDKFRIIISDTLALFPNSSVPNWSLKNEWVEFSKLYFSSSRPKLYYIRSSYHFFNKNRKSILRGLQQDNNKSRPENDTTMTTNIVTTLTSNDVIIDGITGVSQTDDRVADGSSSAIATKSDSILNFSDTMLDGITDVSQTDDKVGDGSDGTDGTYGSAMATKSDVILTSSDLILDVQHSDVRNQKVSEGNGDFIY